MSQLDILLRLGAGMVIGMLIGLERERVNRPAGMRTHFLVALGSAAVTVAGFSIAKQFGGDPLRLAAQVVSGIGFLGAGTILKEGVNVRGLTTSASLWVAACLAVVAGLGLFVAAAVGTLGALAALTLFERLERLMVSGANTTVTTFEIITGKETDITKSLSQLLCKNRVSAEEFRVANDENGRHVTLVVRAKSSKKITALLDKTVALPGVNYAGYKNAGKHSPVV